MLLFLLLWLWLLHVRVVTRHVHAERLLAKAGVANGKVFERSFLGGPLAGEPKPGGRMALESAIGAVPLSPGFLPCSSRRGAAVRIQGPALRAGTGPLRRVAEDATGGWRQARRLPPYTQT